MVLNSSLVTVQISITITWLKIMTNSFQPLFEACNIRVFYLLRIISVLNHTSINSSPLFCKKTLYPSLLELLLKDFVSSLQNWGVQNNLNDDIHNDIMEIKNSINDYFSFKTALKYGFNIFFSTIFLVISNKCIKIQKMFCCKIGFS